MFTAMKSITSATFALMLLACTSAANSQSATSQETAMNIIIESRETQIRVQLADNPSARDFYAQLPLTLKAEDYASSEKIARLPRKLSTQGAPAGHAGKRGDFTYYAPWGNLAMFYKDYQGGTAQGLVYLGKITEGLDVLDTLPAGDITIRAE